MPIKLDSIQSQVEHLKQTQHTAMSSGEIIVVPFPHPGHLFPATELCLRLAERNCKVTLIQPTSSSSSPSSIHPLIHTVRLPIPDSIRIDPSFLDTTLPEFLTDLLAVRRRHSSLPICAIVDEMVGWLITPFVDSGIPAVSFFTSSAISSALEHALSQIESPVFTGVGPTAVFTVPGLPKDVALTTFDHAKFRDSGPPAFGPRRSRDGRLRRRRDVTCADGAVGLIMNTCVEMEGPFLDYVARVSGKPVWAVGPLLPKQFWSALGGPVRDARRGEDDGGGLSHGEVLAWLDSKPRGSVIYVSFGSLVGPSDAELEELAGGLEESGQSFIWVIQPGARQYGPDGLPIVAKTGNGNGGYFPEALEKRAGGRGMIIKGWAPQLLILSHASTAGYVCHCGWNSSVEALACGMPVLAWPIRGDQAYNAKLLVSQLQVGVAIRSAPGKAVSKAQVVEGIEKLMADEEMRKRANSMRSIFAHQLPRNSSAALNDFLGLLASNSPASIKL